MSLALYGHPFSSYTQKALIALWENETPFEFRNLDPQSPGHMEDWLRRWPLQKFPLLLDGERQVVETSIIIEYLQIAHPGAHPLLPADPLAALDVRFLDRFFDLHVMEAMQVAVDAKLGKAAMSAEQGLAIATERSAPMAGWKAIWGTTGPGRRARPSPWPTARRRRRCSTRTGRTRSRRAIRPCAPTAPGC